MLQLEATPTTMMDSDLLCDDYRSRSNRQSSSLPPITGADDEHVTQKDRQARYRQSRTSPYVNDASSIHDDDLHDDQPLPNTPPLPSYAAAACMPSHSGDLDPPLQDDITQLDDNVFFDADANHVLGTEYSLYIRSSVKTRGSNKCTDIDAIDGDPGGQGQETHAQEQSEGRLLTITNSVQRRFARQRQVRDSQSGELVMDSVSDANGASNPSPLPPSVAKTRAPIDGKKRFSLRGFSRTNGASSKNNHTRALSAKQAAAAACDKRRVTRSHTTQGQDSFACGEEMDASMLSRDEVMMLWRRSEEQLTARLALITEENRQLRLQLASVSAPSPLSHAPTQ